MRAKVSLKDAGRTSVKTPGKGVSTLDSAQNERGAKAKLKVYSSKMNGLTGSQIRELGERLVKLRSEITLSIMSKTESVTNTSANSESLIKGDDAEVAEKQRENNAALQELDILKNRLLLVERALRKLDEGIFGLCEESEEEIGYERLTVVPWARYSVRVQEIRERKLREFKVSKLRSEV